jgi:hypothetical protein
VAGQRAALFQRASPDEGIESQKESKRVRVELAGALIRL